jgi:hypothetical protein
MAGLWSRKFDYKNGEDRVCKKCNVPFHAKKPSNICTKCTNANQKLLGQKYREKIGKKENYPFSTKTNEAGKRFSKISAKLNAVWRTGDRHLIRQHYANQLKEAEELGIIKWINDVRTDEAIRARQIKSRNRTNDDFPDTRGWYED